MAISSIAREEDESGGGSERGVQYPGDSLEQAISMLEQIRSSVGLSATKRELLANALGYKSLSGHSTRRLGTLSHFGLLERAGRGAAKISLLGKTILMPTSDSERQLAIVQAARTPNLYATLVSRHAGHALPTMLANMLIRDHGVHHSVAETAASTFRDSMEFAGLLRNGVLYADLENQSVTAPRPSAETERTISQRTESLDRTSVSDGTPIPAPQNLGDAAFTVSLDPRTGRVARIAMPIPMTGRDLRMIEAWVAYMKLTLQNEETPDVSSN